MSDSVFRTANEGTPDLGVTEAKTAPETAISGTNDIEVPYLDYEMSNGKPFSVDYFKLGDTWGDPEGGFPIEIKAIEGYVTDKIKSGEIANSPTAAKLLLKRIEKLTGIVDEIRPTVKIGIINSYIKFMRETNSIKKQQGKAYGNN